MFSLRLNCQIHPQLSQCPSCGVFNINTVSYGLSERKQVAETRYVSEAYITFIQEISKTDSSLIKYLSVSLMLIKQQKMFNKWIYVK